MPARSGWKGSTHSPWILERLPVDKYATRGSVHTTQKISASAVAAEFKQVYADAFIDESLDNVMTRVFGVWRERDCSHVIPDPNRNAAAPLPNVDIEWIKAHIPKQKYVSQGPK